MEVLECVSGCEMESSPPPSLKGGGLESAIVSFISGGIGGVCYTLSGHPFDLVKVKMQTAKGGAKGASDIVKGIIRVEGFPGLYRGVTAPIYGAAPMTATYFLGYDLGMKLVRLVNGKRISDELSIGELAFAGGFSAFPGTVVTAPIERVKVLLQVQGEEVARGVSPKYKGMTHCAKNLIATGGLRSLFKGWEVTLLRDVPGTCVWFGVNEYLKRKFVPKGEHVSTVRKSLGILTAGGIAGMAYVGVSIPLDVVKSKLQVITEGKGNNLHFVDIYRSLMREEGWRGLFKGIRPAMLHAFLANASCFFGYEIARSLMSSAPSAFD